MHSPAVYVSGLTKACGGPEAEFQPYAVGISVGRRGSSRVSPPLTTRARIYATDHCRLNGVPKPRPRLRFRIRRSVDETCRLPVRHASSELGQERLAERSHDRLGLLVVLGFGPNRAVLAMSSAEKAEVVLVPVATSISVRQRLQHLQVRDIGHSMKLVAAIRRRRLSCEAVRDPFDGGLCGIATDHAMADAVVGQHFDARARFAK